MRFDRSETGGQQIIAIMEPFNDQTVCPMKTDLMMLCRLGVAPVLAAMVLAGCGSAKPAATLSAATSFSRDSASWQRADHDRASGADVRVSRGAGTRPGRRHRAEARVQGRRRGQGRAAALPDRSRALYCRAEQRDGFAAEGGSQSRVDHRAGRALQGARRRERGQQAGLRQRRRRARAGGCRRCDGQGGGGDGADQPWLHERDVADHRSERSVAGHGGRVRAGERRDAHDDRPADRSRSTWTSRSRASRACNCGATLRPAS